MNKKFCIIILFLLVVNFAFVVAIDAPTTSVGGGDVEQLQGIIDKLPFDEGGGTNYSRYKPFYSKAEERIDAINLWLDDNAGWMRYIFHMRPQVSVLFALNIYFILFFLLVLVINGPGLWFFIESDRGKRIFGGAMFVGFAAIGLYVGLAYVVYNFLVYIWVILVDSALWLAVIAIVIAIILLIVGFFTGGAMFAWLGRYFIAKRRFKERMEILTGIKANKARTKEIIKK